MQICGLAIRDAFMILCAKEISIESHVDFTQTHDLQSKRGQSCNLQISTDSNYSTDNETSSLAFVQIFHSIVLAGNDNVFDWLGEANISLSIIDVMEQASISLINQTVAI